MHGEWDLLWRLGLALGLSTAIGLERELRQKSAGLRTYTLVGVGSVLFLLVGEYGFFDELDPGHVVLDPSRVAAQIVSGIGFIGGGLIFVRQDAVRGLTTAAGVWLVAVLAIASTLAYLLVTTTYPMMARRLPGSALAWATMRITYADGRGVLREVLSRITAAGFDVSNLNFGRHDDDTVVVDVEVRGRAPVAEVVTKVRELEGVLLVNAADSDPD